MSIEAMKQALGVLEADEIYVMLMGANGNDQRNAASALRQAIEQAEKQAATIEDNSQDWATLDGAAAWHLIERHADNWADVGKMMDEYVAAKLAKHKQAEKEATLQEISDTGQEIEQVTIKQGWDVDSLLSKPEQEPVAWRNAAIRLGEELSSVGPDRYYDMTAGQWLDWALAQEPRGKNSLPAPPKREWVGLTDEEISNCWINFVASGTFTKRNVYEAIEAKLKERNT